MKFTTILGTLFLQTEDTLIKFDAFTIVKECEDDKTKEKYLYIYAGSCTFPVTILKTSLQDLINLSTQKTN
jgi:hypothetical protein